eukprot:CAMPEP_0202688818 /NCGR_PEP_ID=MMETSP1385-20130828/4238_1 /ASSEMBLY_ACC=CAM_ASM_000861 /TAXON_ID=933848 /ORGANISM="Elphidium margaritaceum" /LENGTH=569 /DNA_ID=CAMNT_0049343865 /DNA_START=59 /DNA_END=1768 /DNA_ORIENTATION=+
MLFGWQRLPVPANEAVHFDPRYEDVRFTKNGVMISDYHNRIFQWQTKLNEQKEPIGYELQSMVKYEFDNSSGSQAGKRFDANATSLAWIKSTNLHYYDIQRDKLYVFDVSQWMSAKYGENNTAKIANSKAIINLGDAQVLFLVSHYKGTDAKAKGIERGTDLVQMDIKNEKAVSCTPIQCELLTADVADHNSKSGYQCVYWGFTLNPNGKQISLMVQGERTENVVLFVERTTGNVIWQSRFDFVHDLRFNENGTMMCVFERPRSTEYGYVHVLNLTRLEWICQIQLTYGTSPLGWDGFAFLGNSLVFMAPFDLKVVSPGAVQWRIAETRKRSALEKKLRAEWSEKMARSQSSPDGDDANDNESEQKQPTAEAEAEEQGNNADGDENKSDGANLITPKKFDEILQNQKSKEICVLSIGDRWWDLEPEVTNLINEELHNEQLTHLCLEYAGLNWCMIKFQYPKDRFNDNKKNNEDPNMTLLQGAMSEVFITGNGGDFDVLLLGTIARDPRTKIFNHWIFTGSAVPKTFAEMWRNPNIQKGVIAKITSVNEESNIQQLDYKNKHFFVAPHQK